MTKYTTVEVRERPALFDSPEWQDESLRHKTEQWRDQHKKYTTWEIGIGEYQGQKTIGLYYRGVRTHFAFYLSNILDNLRVLDGICFDAGTSRKELYVEAKEWKRVLKELDVVPRDHPLYAEIQEDPEEKGQSNSSIISEEPVD